jgi:hypothetical protein
LGIILNYFRNCLIADIEYLNLYGGIHEFFLLLSCIIRAFPFCIYYQKNGDLIIVIAVLDARQNPLETQSRLE